MGVRAANGRVGAAGCASASAREGIHLSASGSAEGLVAVVRTYVAEDRASVVDLWDRTGISRPWNDLGAELDRHPEPQLLLVAVDGGGTVVGAVMGAWDGRRGWVYHLGVDAAWRRRGVARALITEVEARLRALGAPKVQLLIRGDNLQAMGFYGKCGYAEEDVRFMSKWIVPAQGATRGRG